MKFSRKVLSGLLVFMTIVIALPTGVSATWKQDNVGWWYDEGNSYATGWRQFNGAWYYFDSTGYMKTGWADINGSYYFFYTNGIMASNATINGFTLGPDGKWISRSQVELERKIAENEAIDRLTSQPVEIIEDKANNVDTNDRENNEDIDGIN